VLAVFRHMTGIVKVNDPERLPDVMQRIVAATATLDPHVVVQMMQTEERGGADDAGLISRIAAAFDDDKVAELLATALGRDGKATVRLAQVFDTLAPDQQRKQRVLSMTRSLLDEQAFGQTSQFRTVWSSMETLLLSYDETPYVSDAYRVALEGVGGRGQMLAERDMPPELPTWLKTLEQDSVRALSVTLVTDLLRIEDRVEYAEALVQDVLALVEDLLLAGDFDLARAALRELRERTTAGVASAAARAALTTCGESMGLREAAAPLGDFDEPTLALFTECCELIGPTAVQALLPAFHSEDETAALRRARDLVQSFGSGAVPAVATLVANDRWFVQRHAAHALAATRSAEAVPALQTLLRKTDPRVLRAAVSALAGINDPSAARAVQTVLRAATGSRRVAVMEALVAEHDNRVVPMLDQLLTESDPFGEDRAVVLDTLDTVAQFADERAVNGVTTVMRRTRWFHRATARAFKRAAVKALVAINTAAATAALDEALRHGDRLLRKAIREVRA
jgi:HEAT repeat protein